MFDLTRFSLSEMTRCGMALRRLGENASGMEEVGERIVRYFYEHLRTPDLARPACALVRVFVTQPYAALDDAQRNFALRVLGGTAPTPTLKCLSLLATAGDEPAWNSRHTSNGHKALPLPSEESVARSPMIAQLMRQLGVDIGALLGGGDGRALARRRSAHLQRLSRGRGEGVGLHPGASRVRRAFWCAVCARLRRVAAER